MGCGSQSSIVGNWQEVGDESSTMVFYKDGTFSASDDGVTVTGKYSLPDNNHIKFTGDGIYGIAGSLILECELRGNKLILTDDKGEKEEYKR